jgi:hypothetical protein
MRIALTTSIVLTGIMLLGCEAGGPGTAPAPEATTVAAPPPPEPEAAAPGAAQPEPAANTEAPVQTASPPAEEQPSAERAADPPTADDASEAEEGDSEKAAAGVGAKGRDYGGPGFVTTPIETLFRIEDRIVFDAQIPNNMKIYKAEHNNKGPKTQEEFMQVIIKDGGVTLPDLYQGDVYWYNPKTEELLVRHPKGK